MSISNCADKAAREFRVRYEVAVKDLTVIDSDLPRAHWHCVNRWLRTRAATVEDGRYAISYKPPRCGKARRWRLDGIAGGAR